MQNDFERRFEFEETDDQLVAINEIKKDMERQSPMDRLLCGDVGFGKTEVALRAAFKCVADGKQCAVLVPTTILAFQHYQTIKKRFDGFPLEVEMLSRFRSTSERTKIKKRLKSGGITRFLLLFRGSRTRSEVVATFLAVLELCRARIIRLAGSETDCTVKQEQELPENLKL